MNIIKITSFKLNKQKKVNKKNKKSTKATIPIGCLKNNKETFV